MVQFVIQLFVAVLGGIASGIQAPLAGVMGQKVGDLTSVFFTYAGGGIAIALITLLAGGGQISEWRSLPWYVFLAGPLGLVVIGSFSYTVPRLGAAAATTVFILSSLAFSAVVDHYGWFDVPVHPLDMTRIGGLIALVIGTWLVIR
ncbi:MAG: DMT family transporter [Candidatus Promineifilaceae bacterium]